MKTYTEDEVVKTIQQYLEDQRQQFEIRFQQLETTVKNQSLRIQQLEGINHQLVQQNVANRYSCSQEHRLTCLVTR